MADFGTCKDCGESNDDTFPDTVRCHFCKDPRVKALRARAEKAEAEFKRLSDAVRTREQSEDRCARKDADAVIDEIVDWEAGDGE